MNPENWISMRIYFKLNIFGILLVLAALGTACQHPKSSSETDIIDGMVLIPDGEFLMGGRSDQAYPEEFPQHKVAVSSF